ncbi:ATP-binding protein [Aestuariimicrobium sp. T2.26MG-19.2B]|uniref:ATP-binding protein n=1 Tax=Aestuariimicrobium sp. T2.26MG-19.2B TaxID=3040679 RepID=UPI0024778B2C|nr:carboxyl transferase domain-containing protein [Aestuariimicrobium sp. T2.26MG-19.2B]CAI9402494.1 Carbamoyl-phosphate synthase large chain [Aestuariimicrobium sp. T2.26MG-19.2B]
MASTPASPTRLRRIAVVNRGEAAVRLIRAVRDLNADRLDEAPIQVIALHTEGESNAMFVRESDVSYNLGPASERPYLNHALLEQALLATGADAVWVGWGFVAEDPAFAELCERLGVTFIGPSGAAMRQLGDKIGSKLIAEEVGVPVAPWSRGEVHTLDEALDVAHRIGYPLMLKATAGGGGRGIQKVVDDASLSDVFDRVRGEAERAFGSGVVFLESLVSGARHVEVQVISDGETAWALGVRDCTVQRRNQKIIEESSSPLLSGERVADVKTSAERLALRVGYRGACTVEFLYQPDQDAFAFLEVNTRLQVEHPITELTTGTDLVKLQIHVAQGGRLEGDRPAELGHAVEARLNAEDPDRDFAPAPGRIQHLHLPQGPGIRVDSGVEQGDTIPADFDSMIAKVIAYGSSRREALARLRRAMADTSVVIDGGTTNKSFVLDLLRHPEVTDGSGPEGWADTGWIDRVRAEGGLQQTAHSGAALVVATIEAYLAAEEIERARFLDTARRGRPLANHDLERPIELKLRGVTHVVRALRVGRHEFQVTIGTDAAAQSVLARFDRLDEFNARLTLGDRVHRVLLGAPGPVQMIEIDGQTHRVSRDEGGVLRSQAPALVVATPVQEGDLVAAGDRVLVLESMKMETIIAAPFAARVREVMVRAGTQVETGAPLARLEPLQDQPEADEEESSIDLELPEAAQQASQEQLLDSLRNVVLGYDADQGDPGTLLRTYLDGRTDDPETLAREAVLLEVFADVAELHRNKPSNGRATDERDQEAFSDSRVHTSREFFQRYLRSLDVEREKLPGTFARRLSTVLAHYGVDDLEQGDELSEAVFRLFLVQQRWSPALAVATGILRAWSRSNRPRPSTRATLDRLVLATQVRFPAIGDLARSIRFRWFDKPMVDAEQSAALAQVPELLGHLDALPHGPARRVVADELVAAPDRLVGFLTTDPAQRVTAEQPLLGILALRHYNAMQLTDLNEKVVQMHAVATASFVADGDPIWLVSMVATLDELTPDGELADLLAAEVAARPAGHQAVVDLYLTCERGDDGDPLADQLRATLADLPVMRDLRRIAIAVLPMRSGQVGSYTFRLSSSGSPDEPGEVVEDRLERGVHPMVARRLNLWRLSNFDLTRIETPGNLLLLDAVAKSNPADERLFALTQVRRLSLVRDEDGQISALPHLERALITAVEAIRRARADLAPKQLDHNHVWIHVWGEFDVDLRNLGRIEQQLAPLTADAGITEVRIQSLVTRPGSSEPVPTVVRFSHQPGFGVRFQIEDPTTDPVAEISRYDELVLRARRRGLVYPYELFGLVASSRGRAVELDLDESGRLVPVDRAPGRNTAGIVVADVSTPTAVHPDGVRRIVLFGDPLKSLGSISAPEADRIVAALDLAEQLQVPVDWFTLSSGARISMDSGTENMDAVAFALKRIVEFTQDGGEINVVVAGINVGAQPYWNAEATMLMHTKGILVMTPDSAMVLTGKQSLDFSGGVSAEDNFGLGGYDRIMGPNGEAQYWAPDLAAAQSVLMRHHEHAWVAPGEPGPRVIETNDPDDRDISSTPHELEGSDFATVGEIFSVEKNAQRKKPFDIRTVMRALADSDHEPLERWAGMADADTAVVHDTTIGGMPVQLVGIESKAIPRAGFLPADGPDQFTAGTLFPQSSKKTARAINSASGNRPLVVLANLSGFDGSPESLRHLQLEYGAEIGRAMVNFRGPIIFVVISRYHGGAFVVFSKALNPNMTVLALEGSYASVLGGAPAAAVVFSRDVAKRVEDDPRIVDLRTRLECARDEERSLLQAELSELRQTVRADMISIVGQEFDAVHSIERAVQVGSVDEIVSVARLRPRIIEILRAAAKKAAGR